VPTFCRHNRYLADCPICTKGTVLDPARSATRRGRTSSTSRPGGSRRATQQARSVARPSRGPFASVGPYDGAEIRIEKVPGGLRLAAWRGGQIERTAPVLDIADLPALLEEAEAKELLEVGTVDRTAAQGSPPGAHGASPGRSGELRDELRVERLDDGRVRVARWILRPNRGWELQEAPVLLPASRFAEALAAAAGQGVLASGGPAQ
jgi:hypothetical protein